MQVAIIVHGDFFLHSYRQYDTQFRKIKVQPVLTYSTPTHTVRVNWGVEMISDLIGGIDTVGKGKCVLLR